MVQFLGSRSYNDWILSAGAAKRGGRSLTYKSWVKRNLDKINDAYKDKNLKATENF